MREQSLVSIVVIFLNAERFLSEAIESIFSQTYEKWELLLVDDGSTDRSTEIALNYATQKPHQVRYLSHPGRRNRGKGASRNLGIYHANGYYLAFLDADDTWLPYKLKEQVAILDNYKDVGMLYGKTLYWYTWTQHRADVQRDFIPTLGAPLDTPINPPELLTLYLRGKASIPCPTDILVRRSVVEEVGGFDETFIDANNIYEDQAFYAKLCIKTRVMVIDRCWDKYRQHSQASMAVAWRTGTEIQARRYFLQWLLKYLREQAVDNKRVWEAIRRQLWLYKGSAYEKLPRFVQHKIRWTKKWILRMEERVLPPTVRDWLWVRK